MFNTTAYGVCSENEEFKRIEIKRHEPGDYEIHMKILYCGICHSDILAAYTKFGGQRHFPVVPGHEIIGQVVKVGCKVTKFKMNDYAGVGTYVDSCRTCKQCQNLNEIGCSKVVKTYNSPINNSEVITKGGYSCDLTVDENYAYTIPKPFHDNLFRVAPLLCAGITVYTPLVQHNVLTGKKHLGVLGLGGLGHMAVKFGKAAGCKVTVLSSSEGKKKDAMVQLNADDFIYTKDPEQMNKAAGTFDAIINTVPVKIDLEPYMKLLDVGGAFIYVGITGELYKADFCPNSLLMKAQCIAGSLTGNVSLTQEMLNYCAKHGVLADVQVIAPQDINTAISDLRNKGLVKYRYVIDMQKI